MFHRTFVCALCFVMTGVAVSTADARIRQRPDLLTAEWDDLIDEQVSISNPLYEQNNNSGVNPMYEPKSMVFNPGDFTPGSSAPGGSVRFELQMDVLLEDGIAEPFNSYEFDLKVFDSLTNHPITEFPDGITIGFVIPGLTQDDIDDAALGFLDETGNPPVWSIIDDNCGTSLNPIGETMITCKTNHLTTFAIGPATAVPEPASLSVLLLGSLMIIRRR